jgi:hypothetical protein
MSHIEFMKFCQNHVLTIQAEMGRVEQNSNEGEMGAGFFYFNPVPYLFFVNEPNIIKGFHKNKCSGCYSPENKYSSLPQGGSSSYNMTL